ncbi:hypothetical protein MPLB_1770001 [Mesorhizobium sp. ORS 3324]|nr:hypothetical protein MPLB_1770001 [Mesorhizobium sp. ORS 3324]
MKAALRPAPLIRRLRRHLLPQQGEKGRSYLALHLSRKTRYTPPHEPARQAQDRPFGLSA